MQRTPIMMLGRVGRVPPQVRTNYMSPRRTTPQQPQNLMRAAFLNGLSSTGYVLANLSGVDDGIIDPWADSSVPPVEEPVMQTVVEPGRDAMLQDARSGNNDPLILASREDVRRGLKVWVPISLLSGALSAFHGYKRDKTVIASFGWGVLGSLFPLITPAVAVAQGFGKPRRG